MSTIKQVTPHSVHYYTKLTAILVLPLLLINLLVSFFILSVTRDQNIQHLTSTADVYVSDLRQKLQAIDHFLLWSILHEPAIKEITAADTLIAHNEGLENLRARVNDFQYSTGPEFQFFLENSQHGSLINISPIQMTYPEYKEFHTFVLDDYTGYESLNQDEVWKLTTINQQHYFFRTIAYKEITLHCVIAVADVLAPLASIKTGKSGSVALSVNQRIKINAAGQAVSPDSLPTDLFHSRLFFQQQQTMLPFSLDLYIDHYNAFRQLVIAQLFLIISPLFIIGISLIGLLYMKRRLLDPIQRFSSNLSTLQENNELLTYENSGIEELESVNDQFKQLVTEIKELKIDIYERQLAQQKIEMNYLKLQIKPHFYLNILTTINSMLTTTHYYEAEQMTLMTTAYFRYLFQSNSDFVQLADELTHVANFLDIQTLRYDAAFDYQLETAIDVEKGLIPPLVLQTFVENTIKHSLSFTETSTINLTIDYADSQKDWLRITFSDNGPGFPLGVLEKLQQHVSLTTDDGKHIGLSNVVQRLSLLYESNYSIRFQNHSDGGILIELVLPYMR